MNIREHILYEDGEIIVCSKPPRIATQTARTGSQDMVSLLKNDLFRQKPEAGEPYLAVIHRLDQPVEGILVFAKTPSAAKELTAQLQRNGFGKEYRAIVCGHPENRKGTLTDYMVKDGRTNLSRICAPQEQGAKKAVLSYEVLGETQDGDTFLNIRLETGRHHQIRVQMAHMGCPIWGDTKYNPAANRKNRWEQIALSAYRLTFIHPKTKKEMSFEIEPFLTNPLISRKIM